MTRTLRARALAVAAGMLLWTTGCVTSPLRQAFYDYYLEGPEAALEVLSSAEIDPADAVLADLESGMAMLELGRYRPALELFDRAAGQLDRWPDPWAVRTDDGRYLGEHHERVMVRTLATAVALALQDVDGAAVRAPAIIAEIEGGGCESCDFRFSRWVAALAFEAVGRRREAIAALSPAAAGDPFVTGEVERLGYGPDPGDGFAPEPAAGVSPRRALVVLALLGVAPQKTAIDFSGRSRWVPWPLYTATWWPSVAIEVALVCEDGSTFPGVGLLDLDDLAPAALEARREHELEIAVAAGHRMGSDLDQRCWTTLPAVVQVIRAELPASVTRCELVAERTSGQDVARELIDLPEEWRDGSLYVLRRIP